MVSKLKALGDSFRWESHKLKEAIGNIMAWKRHVVRSVQQEKAKSDMMTKISPSVSLLIVDFAMKVIFFKFSLSQCYFLEQHQIIYLEVTPAF